MKTDLFDYSLPERLIAQTPIALRDDSRLLVVHRAERRIEHRGFRDITAYLRRDDVLVRNNAAVIPARIHAHRPTGGAVECLLLRPGNQPGEWWCLLRPGKKLPVGASFGIAGEFDATVREKNADGIARVAFETRGRDLLAIASRVGEMPLPPYISAERDAATKAADRERYQTVYANRAKTVAAAAPTAGLHFTPELLVTLERNGIQFADITLHVGLGTFRPITADEIEEHAIHRELYEIPAATQSRLFDRRGRTIAVGTTSLRATEHFRRTHSQPTGADHLAEADLFVFPPADFKAIDALVTNFHQPRSTLLCLVAAFLTPGSTEGVSWFREIYAEAIAREYRFFSYGDAMLIL